jgi:hypothetical protein
MYTDATCMLDIYMNIEYATVWNLCDLILYCKIDMQSNYLAKVKVTSMFNDVTQ